MDDMCISFLGSQKSGRIKHAPIVLTILCRLPQEAAQYKPKGCSRKIPLFFVLSNGAVCSNTRFSRTFLSCTILCHSGQILHSKVLDHPVWSNTFGFRFWGLLARTYFCLVPCGLPIPPSLSRKSFLRAKFLHRAFFARPQLGPLFVLKFVRSRGIFSTVSKVRSDRTVLFKHKNGPVNSR